MGNRACLGVAGVVMTIMLTSCGKPVELVHEVDPASECARLRSAYPSRHGLVLFAGDDQTRERSIDWCFPGVTGFGVIAYNINVPVRQSGTLSVALSEIRPETSFTLVSIAGSCGGNNTGKTIVPHGVGSHWSFEVEPGDYCLGLGKTENKGQDVWLELTVGRP